MYESKRAIYLLGFPCQQLPMLLDYDRENNCTIIQHVPFGYYQAYPAIAIKKTTHLYSARYARIKLQHVYRNKIA